MKIKLKRKGVFGDTASYNYDFGMKVANSVAESPLKIYNALGGINPSSPQAPTLQVTNLVANGNFANGTTGWIGSNVTGFTTSSNEASFTATAQNGLICQNINMESGHIIYTHFMIKSSSASVSFNIAGLGGGYSDGSNSYITKSTRFTWTANTGSWQCSVKDGRASGWDTIYVKQIMVIDLTATFGSGNEPDQASCDKIFATWFDGTVTHNGVYTEITNQAMIDKLKQQNELPIISTSVGSRTAVYNGQTYVTQDSTHPALRDDFAGKTAGDTTGNPNIVKHGYVTALIAPSSFSADDESQVNYNAISTLDGTSMVPSTTLVNRMTQVLLSFNAVAEFERKDGYIPVDTSGANYYEILARKITWLKNNVSNIRCNAYACGSCPSGNKVYLEMYNYSTWQTGTANNSNTSSVPTKLIADSAYSNTFDKVNMLDTDGFVHFTVYTDCARTTDSTLLVLTNHGLSTWDIIENTTRNDWTAINLVNGSVLGISHSITGQVAGDTIAKYHTIGAKVAESGTNSTTIVITNHSLSTGDWICNTTRSGVYSKITVVDANTITCNTAISGQTSGDNIVRYSYLGTQTAESTVIPSTVSIDYANIEIQMKAPAGYDVLVPPNPRRDSVTTPNFDTLLLLQKTYSDITTDYTGKIAGSTTENANISWKTANSGSITSLLSPFATKNNVSAWYVEVANSIDKLDGNIFNVTTSNAGAISQHLFAFNVIADIEKIIGTIPVDLTGDSATDLANKIAWVGANVNATTCYWTGYGSCPTGNKATFARWNGTSWATNSSGSTNTSSSPTLCTESVSGSLIQSDGFAYFLAYTDASDGITASTINTDYIKLTIQFKQPTTAIELMTQNSVDVDVQVANKASAYLVEADLTPICNSLYGGSNAALKSALKAIEADVWAMGSGALNNALSNGIVGNIYTTAWIASSIHGSSSNIVKLSDICSSGVGSLLQATSKLYYLFYSQYPSDGTIPSSVNLDYLNIRVDLSRQSDALNPISINLPDKWSLLIKGIANAYEGSLYNAVEKCFISLYKDSNNYLLLKKNIPSNSMLRLVGMLNGVSNGGLNSAELNWLKYQAINALISQHDGKWYLNILLNNGSILKYNLTSSTLTGLCNLYLGQLNDNTIQADAYYEGVQLFPDVIFDDTIQDENGFTQADRVLKGLEPGFENPELVPLFNSGKWLINANAISSADGKTLTLNATGTYQGAYTSIPILPNNKYQLSATTNTGFIYVYEYYNNILLNIGTCNMRNVLSGTFITTSKTNKILLFASNSVTGTFTFSNLSLKRLD